MCTTRSGVASGMTVISAVQAALPAHRYCQAEITDAVASTLDDPARELLLRRLHTSSRVEHRHLALRLEDYASLGGFGPANDAFVRVGLELAETAVCGALRQAGLRPSDVDLVMSTTVTGVAAPSLEARLVYRIGLRPDVKRVPMFGLGCVAGAAGLARLHDYLGAAPDRVAVLLSVELCSLTVQSDDHSTANLVASSLFGDGATAVVVVGDGRVDPGAQRATPRILDSASHLYPDTERIMGWDVGAGGLKIVLDAGVPELARKFLAADVDGLLSRNGLTRDDIATWVCHPGGPKVIDAVEDALQLPESALKLTRQSLAEVGNLSSSSVLHVLRDTIATDPPTGSYGIVLAMGPGFCSEIVLLRW